MTSIPTSAAGGPSPGGRLSAAARPSPPRARAARPSPSLSSATAGKGLDVPGGAAAKATGGEVLADGCLRPLGDQPRTWVIEMEPGTPIISANHRLNRYALNRQVQDLKDRIGALVRCRYKLPPIARADITVEYVSPPRLKHLRHPLASDCILDSDNIAPTGKALVDGIRACGIFPSDSKKYVRSVLYVLAEETHPRGLLRVHITEAR